MRLPIALSGLLLLGPAAQSGATPTAAPGTAASASGTASAAGTTASSAAQPGVSGAGGAAHLAYVTDDLVLGVYAEPNGAGPKLATLHSGAALETIGPRSDGAAEYTQVRLSDGRSGWVKSTYLTTQEPARVRIRELEEEIDRARATTPELAAAASRSELESLRSTLAQREAELGALRSASPAAPARSMHGMVSSIALLAASCALAFGAGYATLARRIRRKYGGLKVY